MSTAVDKSPRATREVCAADAATESFVAELMTLFQSLNQCGIRYCVFKDHHRLLEWAREKEIDLIVDARDLDRLRARLIELEFLETPSWGHEPHKFFVRYIKQLRIWLKLDVVTAIRLGKPVSALRLDYLEEFMRQRVNEGPVAVPAADSEFLVLLLKSIVNDRALHEARLARLLTLREEIQAQEGLETRLSRALERLFGAMLTREFVDEALTAGHVNMLMQKRPEILRILLRREPVATTGRYVRIRLLRVLRPLLHVLFQRGVSVALLAPDGAGKSTVAETLRRQRHLNVRIIYMGENVDASNVGFKTTAWLRRLRKFSRKRSAAMLLANLASFPNRLLQQWYRYAVGAYHILRGRTVVFDRYVYDSWIAPRPERLMKMARRFLIDLGPAPNLVLLLDAPGTTLYARKGEHSPAFLEEKRQAYLSLQSKLTNMVVVDASQQRTDVEALVTDCIWQCRRGRLVVPAPNEKLS